MGGVRCLSLVRLPIRGSCPCQIIDYSDPRPIHAVRFQIILIILKYFILFPLQLPCGHMVVLAAPQTLAAAPPPPQQQQPCGPRVVLAAPQMLAAAPPPPPPPVATTRAGRASSLRCTFKATEAIRPPRHSPAHVGPSRPCDL